MHAPPAIKPLVRAITYKDLKAIALESSAACCSMFVAKNRLAIAIARMRLKRFILDGNALTRLHNDECVRVVDHVTQSTFYNRIKEENNWDYLG